MNLIASIVRRPYMVAVAVLLVSLFSWLALQKIPVQLKPTVDKPIITITTSYRGASAGEVEEAVTRELEEVLQRVQGVVEMASESTEGLSTITLEFAYGTDTKLSAIDVVNQLSRVPALPIEADEPAIQIGGREEENAVMWLAVRTHYDANKARRIVEESVRSRIERVDGVSGLFLVGGSEREIQVRLDPERLVAHGVSMQQVLDAVRGGNENRRAGNIESSGKQISVRTTARAADASQLGTIVVKRTEGGVVRVQDVAECVDAYRELDGFVDIDGQPGVAMGVQRKTGANVVDLTRGVEAAMEEINTSMRERGIDLALEPVYKETRYIEDALSFVKGNLIVGSILAIAVLLAFLRSARSVLVVALSIPISLVAVFLVLYAFGRTLNVISLAGLAFASGMVVDNAIVVLENVYRHMQRGKAALEACVDGASEVWGGVLASTLTTVAVFVPILVAQDEASLLFVELALAISAAVGLSLVVSISVVPVLVALFFRNAPPPAADSSDDTGTGVFGRAYARFCQWVARPDPTTRPAKIGWIALVIAGCALSYKLVPPAEYLPAGNQNLIFFFAAPIPGTAPETVRDNFKPLRDWAMAQPETGSMFAVTGAAFNGGGVVLKPEHAQPDSLAAFHQRMYGPAMTLAGFQFVVPVRASLFNDSGKQFEVELSGPDFDTLGSASQQLQGALQGIPGVQFVRSSLVVGKPEARIIVDPTRVREAGLDTAAVATVVETTIAGRRVSALVDGGREVDVNVLVPSARLDTLDDLDRLRFVAPDGRVVALSAVARVERTAGPVSIRRLERERNVLLTVNIAPDAPLEEVIARVQADVFPRFAQQLGSSYTLSIGGAGDELANTLSSIGSGFLLSIVIVYLLLVTLFSSWMQPLIILLTIPLSVAGGLVGIHFAHAWSGGQASFDVIGMLGFIILAGIVVNNAILILHQRNNFVAEGLDAASALEQASRSRLRPILMTVITTVAGMLPLAIGGGAGAELYQGLGAIITGGLVVSTLITLFLVPMVVSLLPDVKTT
jgi:HAE1 family hydrophobic/amphiphilic exporter-1